MISSFNLSKAAVSFSLLNLLFKVLFLDMFQLTFTAEKVCSGAPGSVVAHEGSAEAAGGVNAVRKTAYTFLTQDSHEKLQTDQGKDAEAEDG